MLQPRELHATVMYGHDAWNEYWEGSLKRSNDNIGTVSTKECDVAAGYGVNERADPARLAPVRLDRSEPGRAAQHAGDART